MSRLWLIAANTYSRQVLQKGFLASLLSVPLIVVLTIGLVYFMAEMQEDRRPVGYVDNAAILVKALTPAQGTDDAPIAMIPFATTDAARKALVADDIQAYYVLPADYRQTGQVEVVYKKSSGGAAAAQFQNFVRFNLLADEPEAVALRIAAGVSVTIRRPDDAREYPDSASLADVAPIFVILFMALGFIMLIGLNPGQPMLAVAEEKENRTMEMMVTSVSPNTLIAGKVVGTVAIAGTLAGGWVALIVATVVLAVRVLNVSWLQGIHLAPSAILFPASLYVPLYVVLAALMTAVGSTVVDSHEAQQLSFIFIVPLMLPFYVLQPVMEDSNGLLAIILSLFPLSAPTVLPLRAYIQPVPAWQIGLSVILLILSALGAIWLAGRAFHLGMLRYGQRLSWREVLGRTGGSQ
jgi:ABC-2 type transport system permease protein